jgi:hypothetical protein
MLMQSNISVLIAIKFPDDQNRRVLGERTGELPDLPAEELRHFERL